VSWGIVRYDTLYFCALKSWRVASLICRMEPKIVMEETEMSRGGPIMKSMESVLDDESEESTEEEDVSGVGSGDSEL